MSPTIADQEVTWALEALDLNANLRCNSGDNTDEKLSDLLAGLRLICDRYGFRWEHRLQNAELYYRQLKDAERAEHQTG